MEIGRPFAQQGFRVPIGDLTDDADFFKKNVDLTTATPAVLRIGTAY